MKTVGKSKTVWAVRMISIMCIWGIGQFNLIDAGAAPPKGVFKEAIHYDLSADSLDPSACPYQVSAYLPMYLIHDALVKAMPEGIQTPCLAESWSISPDYKIYEFKIRKGVKFHNGDTVTADDVVFSFWRYRSAQAKLLHDKAEKVEAVNPYLVRFQFKEPFLDFLDYQAAGATSIGWIVPKKYIEKVGDAEFKKRPIGAGPYKFVEFVPGVKLVGEAFEDYWRKVPNIKRIEIHIIPDSGTRLAMLKRGETDIATNMQGVVWEEAKKTPTLRAISPGSGGQTLVYMAAQWDPKSPWSDPRVRKAASLAIDRKTLCDVFWPGSHGIGALGLKGDPDVVQYPADPYDPKQAKKLLAEAGYPNGFPGGKFYPYGGGLWEHGEQIATYWKAIGISVDTVLLERPAFVAQRDGGKMKGAVFIDFQTPPTIGMRLSYLLGKGAYGGYPDIQAVWEQYQRETSPKARKELIERTQKLIHDKTLWIPLEQGTGPGVVGPRVKGYPFKIPPQFWYATPYEDLEMNE